MGYLYVVRPKESEYNFKNTFYGVSIELFEIQFSKMVAQSQKSLFYYFNALIGIILFTMSRTT